MFTTAEVTSRHARSLITDAIVEMSERLDDEATVVTDSIHRACPGLDDDLYQATRQSVRSNLGLVTTMLAAGLPPESFAPPEEALAYARAYVHRGLTFELLTDVYRAGEHAYAQRWREQLAIHAATLSEFSDGLGYLQGWLFSYVAQLTRALAAAYADERERCASGTLAVRSEQLRAILDGADVDPIDAGARLGYRLEGRHLAFVIVRDRHTTDRLSSRALGELERAAAQLARSVGATSFVSLPFDGVYAGWMHVTGTPGDPVAPPVLADGVRIALGRPGVGLEGFRRSHQEALLTRRVLDLAHEPPCLLSFDHVTLEALLTRDLAEARRFVEDQLGPLLDGSASARRALETLEVYLEEGSSYVRTGRRLGIHENTAAYRVRRAEGVLQRRCDDRQLELRTALRLTHFLARG